MAQPFNTSDLELSDDAFAIDENVGFLANFFKGAFAASQNGILAYQQGFGVESQLIRLDSDGNELGEIGEVDRFQQIRL